jgi:hypothetical protein
MPGSRRERLSGQLTIALTAGAPGAGQPRTRPAGWSRCVARTQHCARIERGSRSAVSVGGIAIAMQCTIAGFARSTLVADELRISTRFTAP